MENPAPRLKAKATELELILDRWERTLLGLKWLCNGLDAPK